MTKQKHRSLHSKTNSAFLKLMKDNSSNKIAEVKDKIISEKSIEIRCVSAKTMKSSINKCILTKNSSMSLEKMKRVKSASIQRQNNIARVQVNIMIDAFGFTMDKFYECYG
jgi:hypothetical protein